MDTNITFRIDSQTKARMTEICNQLGMTPSTAFNIFANAFVRAGGMPFAVRLETPATEITREQMLADIPFFTDDEITDQSFETYSPLDALSRCGTAFACVGQDLMPTEERGSIGQVKPSGWHLVKYDCVDGKYLYNRCHLIRISADCGKRE